MTAAEIRMRRRRRTRRLDRLIFHAILLAGMLGVVSGRANLLVLLVLGRPPDRRGAHGAHRVDARRDHRGSRLPTGAHWARALCPRGPCLRERAARRGPARARDAASAARFPLEELLLELAWAPCVGDLVLEASKIWTGSNGLYERAMSEPPTAAGLASRSQPRRNPCSLALRGLRSSPAHRVAPGTPGGSRRRTTQSRPDRKLLGRLLGLILVERQHRRASPSARRMSGSSPSSRGEWASRCRNIQLDAEAGASLGAGQAPERAAQGVTRSSRLRGRRRAAANRARCARRRPAAAGRAGREPAPGARLGGFGPEASNRASSSSWGTTMCRRRSRSCVSSRTSILSPAPRRSRPRRSPLCRRTSRPDPDPARGGGDRPPAPGRRGDGVLLFPRSAAERWQARRGVGTLRRRSASPSRKEPSSSKCPTMAPASTRATGHRAPGSRRHDRPARRDRRDA